MKLKTVISGTIAGGIAGALTWILFKIREHRKQVVPKPAKRNVQNINLDDFE